jgi:DNA mismatch repair protein MutH
VSDAYDKSSVQSIMEFAKRLTGHSLSEVEFIPKEIANSNNKGDLGTLVETFYFRHTPGNFRGPDFFEAGLELKTTGVVPTRNGGYRAKERLVMSIINYEELAEETWETSSFLKKSALMLVLFYLYETERPVVDRRFVLEPYLFDLMKHDWQIIKHDWETIRTKVVQGRAHELSEGDTYYLGACRKGAGGHSESLRKQPNSDVGAPARAFSFKAKFVNSWIHNENDIPAGEARADGDLGKFLLQNFSFFENLTVDEIAESFFQEPHAPRNKRFHRNLAIKMLDRGGLSLQNLDRAEIEMKTVRLNEFGRPRESMSFPGFTFLEILEQSWEESAFCAKLEKKFLFVVFQPDSSGAERFVGAKLWNMPYEDRLEAQRVWEETKRRVREDATNLPRLSESLVAHVRPKGRDGDDKIPTPQGTLHLRQAFWLNARYLAQVLA